MTYAISAAGLTLVRKFEGFRAKPLQLADGKWLVGYGHVRAKAGKPVTQAQARELLSSDLAPFERLVNASVKVEVTQAQFDALVSFAFSIGAEGFVQSQVLRRVNAGEFIPAGCAMDAWRKAEVNGELQVVDALVRRRTAEKALFFKDVAHEAAPSALLRPKLDHAASILGAPSATLAPVRNIGVRLTEILRSDPATEALLLTQRAQTGGHDGDDEITTAHAKPSARPLADIREATRRAYAESQSKEKPRLLRFPWKKREDGGGDSNAFTDNFGLGALMALGLVLVATGASIILNGEGGFIDIIGAAALITPGLAAMMAGYSFRRPPERAPSRRPT